MSLSMFGEHVREVSVLLRMICAATHLPPELPNRWKIVVDFGTCKMKASNSITPDKARVLLENLQDRDKEAAAKCVLHRERSTTGTLAGDICLLPAISEAQSIVEVALVKGEPKFVYWEGR